MSEFIATARIIVRPDTSRFRTDLEAQLKSVLASPVKIPVIPVVGSAFAGAVAGTAALTAAQQAAGAATAITADALASATTIARQYSGVVDLAAVSTTALAASQEREAISATKAAAAQAAHARSLNQGVRGAAASALTLFGLRGATLAASAGFLAGTAAVVGFAKAVQSAAALETELNVFRVTAGATADEMVRVAANAQQLGRDITLPGVTASSAATAMTELAKAGLSVRDSIDGARGTLQLATAAQIDVKAATELVAGALNSFGLAGRDSVKVADLLAGAAKESQGDITDMATALAQAAAVSKQFGVSIEDTVTLLTQLAQAGLSGGRAGTSLRVAFLRLVNPPADAAKALKELNVQIRDAQGNLRPQIFTDIQRALRGYTKEQQDATLATIFGSDAIRTAAIIGNKGAAAYRETAAAVTEAGLAQEQAAARTAGLAGDVENLSNQASSLGLTIGNVSKGPISFFTKLLAEQVSVINDSVTGIVLLGSKFRGLGESAAGSIPFVKELGVSFGDVAKATSFLNPVTAQLALAGKAAKLFGTNTEEAGSQGKVFGNIIESVTESVDSLTGALAGAFAQLKASAPKDSGLNVKQIENIVVGFDAAEVRAKIGGDNAKLLEVLDTEQAFLEAQLQRQYVKRRPALRRAVEQALLGTVNDIKAIQGQATAQADKVKRDAEQAARSAEQAVRSAEQDLLARQGLGRDRQQNRIAAAEATAGLKDDIREQKDLATLVRAQIAAVTARISVEGGRRAAVVALQTILLQVDKAVASLVDQQKKALQEQKQALLQSASLDVEFAQINDNANAEVSARQRLIVQLKKQQDLVKRGTTEWKKLRNDIAAENAAIEEIRNEKKKQNNAFAQASFEFLQTQQGFAANLLGNLIPRGATGGLVGGGVQAALAPVAGVADGKAGSSPTAGQAQTTNSILGGILNQMKILNGEQVAPEARRQMTGQQSTMDTNAGGYGG